MGSCTNYSINSLPYPPSVLLSLYVLVWFLPFPHPCASSPVILHFRPTFFCLCLARAITSSLWLVAFACVLPPSPPLACILFTNTILLFSYIYRGPADTLTHSTQTNRSTTFVPSRDIFLLSSSPFFLVDAFPCHCLHVVVQYFRLLSASLYCPRSDLLQ